MRFDDFELDEDNAQLKRAGRAVPLPPKAFAVLCTLARQSGRLTKKDDLLDAVWGHRHVSESVLKTTISQVRAALEDDAAHPRYIETAARFGYRFIGQMRTPALAGEFKPAQSAGASVAPSAPMIGRKAALARLHAAWDRACAGEHQLFWIAGDAGVGKTTLIENFARAVGSPVIAHGQCVEQYGAGEPYLPMLQALGALCRAHSDMPSLLRAIAPTWFVQMPWLATEAERAALSRELVGTSQERMVRELRELIERFTERRPLLLVTEDMHWCDHATLKLMDHFARRRGSVKVMWIASFRLTQVIAEEHPLQQLRHELRLHRLCEELLLDPFSESEVAEYLDSRMPQTPVAEAFVHRLHAYTDGLPLFLANVVETILAQPDARPDALSSFQVPEDLAGTLEKQIARLPEEVRELLEAASVCGMEFQAKTVADVAGLDVDTVNRRCDDLVRRQYWLRNESVVDLPDGTLDSRYAFRHALYKHVFYRRLGPAQRMRYHRLIAQSLAASRKAGWSVTPAELASHHELGREYPQALRYYSEAAGRALNQFAPQEAIDLTTRALALLPQCPDGPQRLELELPLAAHRGLACSHLRGLASPEAREAFERVLAICNSLPQTPERALQLNGLGWMLHSRGEYVEAQKLADSVYTLGISHDNRVLQLCACTLRGMAHATQGQHPEACDWLQRGILLAEQVDGRIPPGIFLMDPEVTLRCILAVPLMSRGLADQAREQAARAIDRAEQIGQPMARAISLRCGAALEIRLESVEGAAQRVQALQRVVEAAMLAPPAGPTLWLRGWVAAHSGDPETGLKLILEGHGLHMRQGMLVLCTEALLYAAEASILRRNFADARRYLTEGLEWARRLDEGLVLPELLLRQAHIELAEGNASAAEGAMRESARVARECGALNSELQALVALVERPGRTEEDRAALAAAYGRFTEGLDVKICCRARELLAIPVITDH